MPDYKWCQTCGHEPSWHTVSRHTPNPCHKPGCDCPDYAIKKEEDK